MQYLLSLHTQPEIRVAWIVGGITGCFALQVFVHSQESSFQVTAQLSTEAEAGKTKKDNAIRKLMIKTLSFDQMLLIQLWSREQRRETNHRDSSHWAFNQICAHAEDKEQKYRSLVFMFYFFKCWFLWGCSWESCKPLLKGTVAQSKHTSIHFWQRCGQGTARATVKASACLSLGVVHRLSFELLSILFHLHVW